MNWTVWHSLWNVKLMSYLCTVHTLVAGKILVYMAIVVVVFMVPPADCSCLCLALSLQSGSSCPGAFLPCRTRLFPPAILSLIISIWFHHQLSAVRRRGARLHRRSGLPVVRVVVAVLIFGDFGGLWDLSGLWVVAVMVMVVMVLVALVLVVVMVVVVAWLLVMLHRNGPDAIQAHVLQETL